MALEGTLKDFALPDIFQLIALQKKTGVLNLNDKTDEVTIAFKDGMLVSADSKKKRLEERLGTRLVRSGLITEGQLHDALEKQKQTFQRLGVILVGEQLVRAEDLRKALEIQTTQIVYRVFRWEDAEYRFDQDAQIDYDKENFRPIGAESLLMEGMRILDEWPIVEKAVPSMQAVYERVAVNQPVEIEKDEEEADEDDDFDFDLGAASPKEDRADAIKLSPQEGAAWNLLDSQRTVEDIMYLARLSEFDAAKAIYDLLNRDLVRERKGGGAAAAAKAAAASRSEASPLLAGGLTAAVFALALAGMALFPKNPLFTDRSSLGLTASSVERQQDAVLATRLDRIVRALEAYKLANGDQGYPAELEELVDLKLLRDIDVSLPYGVHFDYRRLAGGQGYELQAVDAENQELPELERIGGEQETAAD